MEKGTWYLWDKIKQHKLDVVGIWEEGETGTEEISEKAVGFPINEFSN